MRPHHGVDDGRKQLVFQPSQRDDQLLGELEAWQLDVHVLSRGGDKHDEAQFLSLIRPCNDSTLALLHRTADFISSIPIFRATLSSSACFIMSKFCSVRTRNRVFHEPPSWIIVISFVKTQDDAKWISWLAFSSMCDSFGLFFPKAEAKTISEMSDVSGCVGEIAILLSIGWQSANSGSIL